MRRRLVGVVVAGPGPGGEKAPDRYRCFRGRWRGPPDSRLVVEPLGQPGDCTRIGEGPGLARPEPDAGVLVVERLDEVLETAPVVESAERVGGGHP